MKTAEMVQVQSRILDRVRTGVYPVVAGEAEGISREQFEQWLSSRRPHHVKFEKQLRKAHGEARADAEQRAFVGKSPRLWLTMGPARAAWGQEVAEEPPAEQAGGDSADDVLAVVLDALREHPAARIAVAAALQGPRLAQDEG